MEATVPAKILYPPPSAYRPFETAATDTLPYLRELRALLTAENADGYIFQAFPYAYEHANRYLEMASGIMGRLFPRPEFVSDGEGGIDIEWINGLKKVTLSCRRNDTQRDYIYWQENADYDARDFSP